MRLFLFGGVLRVPVFALPRNPWPPGRSYKAEIVYLIFPFLSQPVVFM